MKVKLLLLISALAFLTATSAAQDNYRPRKKDLTWGAKAGDLRMAVWTNPLTDTMFVAVRNFSSGKICYCARRFDILPAVYARRNAASEWQEITLKVPPQPVIEVSDCRVVRLKPTEEMPSYARQTAARRKVVKKNNYSFSVDLRHYSFPADWSGTAEAKTVLHFDYSQSADCSQSGKKVIIESPIFAINLPFPEAGMQK